MINLHKVCPWVIIVTSKSYLDLNKLVAIPLGADSYSRKNESSRRGTEHLLKVAKSIQF
jgi:hypothetical protein